MKEEKAKKEKKAFRFSIKKKTLAMIIVFATVLSVVSLLVCTRVINNITDEMYRARATDLTKTVAQIIDAQAFARTKEAILKIYNATENKVGSEDWGSDEFNAYTALYDEIADSDDFKLLLAQLRKIQDVNDVKCLYLSFIDVPTVAFIYAVDADPEDPCPPGCIDPIYDENKGLLDDPTIGLPAYVTDTEEYGWLVTAGTPVYINTPYGKEVVGYAMADISMETIRDRQFGYVMRLLTFLLITVVLLCVVGAVVVDFILIRPIRALSASAAGYCSDKTSTYHDGFSKLNISTRDEIEELSNSMKQMEKDINEHIENLLSVHNELSATQDLASEMTELANTDALTGVRNKLAYDREIEKLDLQIAAGGAQFGAAIIDLNYLKKTNDTYGHEAGNNALVALCGIICGVFAHSPVFRIGGDEFAVILQKDDYDRAEELIGDFNKRIMALWNDQTLPPEKRISAALGFSRFEQSDTAAADVFRRADKEMYENKRAMKAERGDA